MKLISGLLVLFVNLVFAQDYQDYEQPQRAAPVRLRPGNGPVEARPTPVAILKQINRHNEDGSYTYGYEGGDGSFKIETKLATGEVKGKYGYVDTTGKVRVVEYGANKYGFQPSGEGITVAPPTLVDETTNKDGIQLDYEEQEHQQQQQFQQQPQKPFIARVSRPQPQPQSRPAPRPQPRPQYSDYDQEQEQPQQRQQYSPGPAPPRLQIPGAQPNDVVYAPQSRPARPESEYSQVQSFGAGPQFQQQQQQQQQQHQQQQQQQHPNVRISRPQFAPAPSSRTETFAAPVRPVQEPNYQPQQQSRPQYVPHAQQSAPQGRSTSVLDQLAKDYALPQNGANALHDISFGYF